jgi:hypothetical protein
MMLANPNFFIVMPSSLLMFEPWRECRGSDAVVAGDGGRLRGLLS